MGLKTKVIRMGKIKQHQEQRKRLIRNLNSETEPECGFSFRREGVPGLDRGREKRVLEE